MTKKILIVRFSSIGDVILSTPLVRCLRAAFPNSEIDFLVKKEFASILSNNPHISKLIVFDKSNGRKELWKTRSLIKEGGYTHIIDIQSNIRSFLLRTGVGAIVSGFSKRLVERFFLIKLRKNIYKEIKPVYLRYFEAVEELGVKYDSLGTELFYQQTDKEQVLAELELVGINSNSPLLIIAPGAQWANKRWLPSGFARSADELANKHNFTVVLLGGKGDIETCNQVQQLMQSPSFVLAGKPTLMQSAALTAMADLVITNDTGMLHMAQAVKTPVLAVFGPTTKELGFFPLPDKSKVAEAEVSCRPCTQKGLNNCPKTHFYCMKHVNPEKVISLAQELINTENSKK